uniref:Uncharacterized protein n=1 Tax=Cannabis sativa TaxID=3483 RepID=A0A803QNZ5_CANSA
MPLLQHQMLWTVMLSLPIVVPVTTSLQMLQTYARNRKMVVRILLNLVADTTYMFPFRTPKYDYNAPDYEFPAIVELKSSPLPQPALLQVVHPMITRAKTVHRDDTRLYLTQTRYIKALLKQAKMTNVSLCPTPSTARKLMSLHEEEPMHHPTISRSIR